jgi:hypothetical protein
MNVFDYVNQILDGKKQLIVDDLTERGYEPFLVNRALSQHKDCIGYASEMNTRHYIDKKMQNDFLLNTVRKQKRSFAKWAKAESNSDIDAVKTAFGISTIKAREVVDLLSEEDLNNIRQQIDIGGISK